MSDYLLTEEDIQQVWGHEAPEAVASVNLFKFERAICLAQVAKLQAQGWKSPEDFKHEVDSFEQSRYNEAMEQARQDEQRKCQQDTIDALNDYGAGKISLERLAERLGGMNVYELIDAFRSYQSGDSPEGK